MDEIDKIFDKIEDLLLNGPTLSKDQIDNLKIKVKEMERNLKKKFSPKTITVSNETHQKIKKYCVDNNIKLGDWVEKTLLKNIH